MLKNWERISASYLQTFFQQSAVCLLSSFEIFKISRFIESIFLYVSLSPPVVSLKLLFLLSSNLDTMSHRHRLKTGIGKCSLTPKYKFLLTVNMSRALTPVEVSRVKIESITLKKILLLKVTCVTEAFLFPTSQIRPKHTDTKLSFLLKICQDSKNEQILSFLGLSRWLYMR